MKRCEICGKPADQSITDTWAASGKDDYLHYAVVAKTHRCHKHVRDGVTYTSDQGVYDILEASDDSVVLVSK